MFSPIKMLNPFKFLTNHRMKVKVCRKCGAEKALVDFATDRRMPDGKENRCKLCKESGRKAPKKKKKVKEPDVEIIPVTPAIQKKMDKVMAKVEEKLPPPQVHHVKIEREPEPDHFELMDKIREKHGNSYFSLAFHPNLDGYVVQLNNPRYHKEGKNVKKMLQEVLDYEPAPRRDREEELIEEKERGW